MTADVLVRCTWPGLDDPLYTHYHDTEWGVPKTDDRVLFEKMILEGFQSGLSWLTILRKRENFRTAFDDFDAAKIARYDDRDKARLMADTGIIRNRLKIDATIDNARAYLKLAEKTSLAHFLWSFVDGRPRINTYRTHADVPAQTEVSKIVSKALKAEGFRFVGPTTMYAFMQASGLVNDHLLGCHRHHHCSALMKTFELPATLPGRKHGTA
jgi:DNA-3-methyladenine glycosylase I